MPFVPLPSIAKPGPGARSPASRRARPPLAVLVFALLLARPQAGAAHMPLVDWFDQPSVEAALVPVAPWPLPAPVVAPDAERAAAITQRLGPPPAGAPLPFAQREGLVSLRRVNRRLRIATLAGFVAALAVSVTGLWWVWTVAFG